MTPGTAAPEGRTVHYSRTGSDPSKSLRKQLEEGMVLPAECVLLRYHNRKRGEDVCVLFPRRLDAEAHVGLLVASGAVHKNDGRCVIRTVEEALA